MRSCDVQVAFPPPAGRDRIERKMKMDKRDGRWWVTVGELIAHGRYKPSEDGVSARLAKGKVKSMPVDFADEIRRLWNQMVNELRVGLHEPLATRAAELLGAELAALSIRDNDRSTLYT